MQNDTKYFYILLGEDNETVNTTKEHFIKTLNKFHKTKAFQVVDDDPRLDTMLNMFMSMFRNIIYFHCHAKDEIPVILTKIQSNYKVRVVTFGDIPVFKMSGVDDVYEYDYDKLFNTGNLNVTQRAGKPAEFEPVRNRK